MLNASKKYTLHFFLRHGLRIVDDESKLSSVVFSLDLTKILLITALLIALPYDSIYISMAVLSSGTVIIDGFLDLRQLSRIKPVCFHLLCTRKIVVIATCMYSPSVILLIVSNLFSLISNNNIHSFGEYCFPFSGMGIIILGEEDDGLLLVMADESFQLCLFLLGLRARIGVLSLDHLLFLGETTIQ